MHNACGLHAQPCPTYSYDLLYNCSEVSKTQFFILNTNNGRYRLIFAHLYDNLYGLDEVIDNETDIIYDDKSEHSIKDFLLLSPMGYGNILPLKVVPYENGIMVFCDEMIYLENDRTAYFYSAKKEVFMVTNLHRKYLVELIDPYKGEVEVTQEIKDNIKLI